MLNGHLVGLGPIVPADVSWARAGKGLNVGDLVFVVAAAFEFDEFLDPPGQLGVRRRFFNPLHVLLRKTITAKMQNAIWGF